MRAIVRSIREWSVRTNTGLIALVMLGGTLAPLLSASRAYAYTSPYYAQAVPGNIQNGGQSNPGAPGAMYQPQQVIKRNGILYYADTGRALVTKTQGSVSSVIAGRVTAGASYHDVTDGASALDSTILPCGIEVSSDNTVYIADCYAHVVVRLDADSTMHVVAGNGQTGSPVDAADATQTPFNSPNYVKFGPDGLLYVSDDDMVRRINSDGSTTRIAGTPGTYSSITEGGVATEQVLPAPVLAGKIGPNILDFDSQGRLYIATQPAVFRVDNDGTIHTVLQATLYTSDHFNFEEQPLSSTEFTSPFQGFAIDPADDSMWVANSTYTGGSSAYFYEGAIVHIHDGIVTTVAGGGNRNSLPAYGNNLQLSYVSALFFAPEGMYFVTGGSADLLWNKNPNHTEDQFAPSVTSAAWSLNPKLVSEDSTLTVQYTDPYEGAQNSGVVGAEYFVGTDPGEGNGTPMSFDGTNYVVDFPANGLTPGFHRVGYRAVDAASNWGQVFYDGITVNGPPTFTTPDTLDAAVRTPFYFDVTAAGGLPENSSMTLSGTLPAGVKFDNSGGGHSQLSGQPLAGTEGTYLLTFTADNGSGAVATQNFTLIISDQIAAPTIISEPAMQATYGVPYTATINTTGFPLPKITRTGVLPPGMTFVDNGDGTATIAGTAARSALGEYPLTIKAKNSQGTVTQNFTLIIVKVPVFKGGTPAKRTIMAGDAFSQNVATSAYTTAQLYAYNIPSSITFTDNGDGTGAFSGTTVADDAGTYDVNIYAYNPEGYALKNMTLNIKGAPTMFLSDNNPIMGVGYNADFQLVANGFPAPKFSRVGALPHGITFDRTTGTFHGTPNAAAIGDYPITVTAKNAYGSVSQTLIITVKFVIVS